MKDKYTQKELYKLAVELSECNMIGNIHHRFSDDELVCILKEVQVIRNNYYLSLKCEVCGLIVSILSVSDNSSERRSDVIKIIRL